MIIVLVFLVALMLIALSYGWYKAETIDFSIELKIFSNPYYRLGITYEKYITGEDEYVEEFIIGLFAINIVFVFYKFDA